MLQLQRKIRKIKRKYKNDCKHNLELTLKYLHIEKIIYTQHAPSSPIYPKLFGENFDIRTWDSLHKNVCQCLISLLDPVPTLISNLLMYLGETMNRVVG